MFNNSFKSTARSLDMSSALLALIGVHIVSFSCPYVASIKAICFTLNLKALETLCYVKHLEKIFHCHSWRFTDQCVGFKFIYDPYSYWDTGGCINPISITGREVMKLSHIGSLPIYHKYMKELIAFGYIKYLPSYHPILGSHVWINEIV